MAYLRRQFKTIAVILIPLAIIVFVTSTEVAKPDLDVAGSEPVDARRVSRSRSRACSGRSRSSPAASCPASPASSA